MFSEIDTEFTPWIKARDLIHFPKGKVVYLVRVTNENGMPHLINRARKKDSSGIVYVGSGGASRLRLLQNAVDLKNENELVRHKHHHMMRWWLRWDFDSLFGICSSNMRNIEVCWTTKIDCKQAKKYEKQLLLEYKSEFADIPICNLRT